MSETFRIEITASNRQAVSGIQSVEGELDRLNRTATSTNSLLKSALQIAGISSGIVLVERAAAGLRDYSDAYVQIQNQLTIVTRGTAQLNDVTEQLLGVSNRTRSSFEATTKLYARTALATRDIGTSQADLLGITESVNKAIILSGASAKESSNGLIQLSQAIASNRLAGDELRSVLEQLPVVADVIAKQLGVTRGELRELGVKGKITAQVILDGFKAARAEIDERFAKTIPTVSQSVEILKNNVIALVGELNKSTGATSAVAVTLGTLAFNLKNLLLIAGAVGARFAAIKLAGFVQGLVDAVKAQSALNAAIAGGDAVLLGSAEASAQKASFTLAAAQSEAALTRATISGIEAQQASAVVTFESTDAAQALALANVRASQVDLRRAQTAILSAEAEQARAIASGLSADSSTILAVVQEDLVRIDVRRLAAVQAVAVAEAELAAAVTAAGTAQAARAASAGQLAELEARLAGQTVRVAEAQAALNVPLAAAPGLFARIGAAIFANPIGIATVAVVALLAVLVDLKGLAATIGTGVRALADGFFGLVTLLRSAISLVPALSGNSQVFLKLLLATAAALVSVRLAGVSAGVSLAAGLGAALTVVGLLAQGLDRINEIYAEEGKLLAQNSPAQQFQRAHDEVLRLGAAVKEGFGGEAAVAKLAEAVKKLNRLERERLRDIQSHRDEDPFTRETDQLRELISLFGKAKQERALELDLIKQKKALLKEGVDIEAGSDRETALRDLLAQKQAAEDLANVVDSINGPDDDFRRNFALLTQAEDDGRISADQLSGALNKLFEERRGTNPLFVDLRQLKSDLASLERSVPSLLVSGGVVSEGRDPAGQLADLRAANRERAVQAELDSRLNALRAEGKSTSAILAAAPELEALIRQNAEKRRALDLDEQQLSLRRDLADQASVALLPDFEKGVQQKILALRDLNLTATDQSAREAEIRRNASLEELGGILNGLQSPLLAQAQAQQNLADQTARAEQLLGQGAISATQYALALQELQFRADAASTTFGSGFSVALQQAQASTTEATVGQTTFTSAINAAGQASSQFAQTGTVDFRQLALNVIAEISKIITQLLVLRLVQSAVGFFGGNQAGELAGNISPDEFGGNFRALGGSVDANQPVIVGEQGTPELFVPGRSGTVLNGDQVSEALSRAGGGGGGQVVVQAPPVNVVVNNSWDPQTAVDAMDSPAGSRVVQNHIARNPNAVKRSLGS